MALLSSLTDPFNQTTLNASLWSSTTGGGATLSYSSSGAQCNFPSSSTSSTIGQISSVNSYDLTGNYGYTQVLSVASTSTNADSAFHLEANSSNWIGWTEEAGTLYAQKKVSGTQSTLTSFAYNSTTHKWWRIRESGGTTFWDTSTDGITWTNRTSATNPITVTSLQVFLTGSCYENESNPGTFRWNNFNTTSTIEYFSELALLGIG